MSSTSADSITIEIAQLENEYETVLKQYEEAYQTYLDYLQTQQDTTTGGNKEYVQLKDKTYWGTASLEEKDAADADTCQSLCSANKLCTGATYSSSKRYCWMRKGDGQISKADNMTAIVPKAREYLMQLRYYNRRLIEINEKLADLYAALPPPLATDEKMREQQQNLIEFHSQLIQERDDLEKDEAEIETINVTRNTQDIVATQGYTQFRLWLLLGAVLILISLKMTIGVGIGWPLFIIGFIALSFFMHTIQSFMFLCFMVLAAIIIKFVSDSTW